MSKISIRDLWIILAGYLAAMHVGKLSAVIPILQQDLGLSFTQTGFSLSFSARGWDAVCPLYWCFFGKSEFKALPDSGVNHFRTEQYRWPLDSACHSLIFLPLYRKYRIFKYFLVCAAIVKRISQPETLNFKMGLWSSYMGVGVSLAVLLFLFYSNT